MKTPGLKSRSTTKMMVKQNHEGIPSRTVRVDKSMKNIVDFINTHPNIRTLACCCGHGKYPMTIVIEVRKQHDDEVTYELTELMSGKKIPRKRRFYFKDKDSGLYYIPEILEQ